MNRHQTKIEGDPTQDRSIHVCGSTDERDAWLRVIPRPLPPGYRQVVRWTDDFTFEIYAEPISDKELATARPDGAVILRRRELEAMPMVDLLTLAPQAGVKQQQIGKKPTVAMLAGLILKAEMVAKVQPKDAA